MTNYYESLGDIYAKYSFFDLKNEEVGYMIDDECENFLSEKLYNKKHMIYFNYKLEFDKTGHKVTILPENIICALWFIGEFPSNVTKVLENNYFENREFIYTFDKKSCKLKKRKK